MLVKLEKPCQLRHLVMAVAISCLLVSFISLASHLYPHPLKNMHDIQLKYCTHSMCIYIVNIIVLNMLHVVITSASKASFLQQYDKVMFSCFQLLLHVFSFPLQVLSTTPTRQMIA